MVSFTIPQMALITDESGAGGDARLADLLLAAGKYTIEATTSLPGDTGIYDLIVRARLATTITGLYGVATHGPGTVTATDDVTVDLPHIPCTTTAGTISPESGAERTLTVNVKAGTTATATVVCDEYFRPEARVTAQYEARPDCVRDRHASVGGGVDGGHGPCRYQGPVQSEGVRGCGCQGDVCGP